MKDRTVLKPHPECKACHAKGTISQPADGRVHLLLLVDHGKTTNSWELAGISDTGRLVFSGSKFELTYTNGVLTGLYSGQMRAKISLEARRAGAAER